MAIVAMLPAAAVVVGAVIGIAAPIPVACWLALMGLGWAASVIALVRRRAWATVVACLAGFAGAAAVLAQRATRDALEPAILAQSAPYRIDVVGTAGGMPLLVEGDLLGDAIRTEFGAAMTVDVRRVRLPRAFGAVGAVGTLEAFEASSGRVRVTIAGALVGDAFDAWRGGRRIRAPMVLNAPVPYRNFGIVDQEQRLALAGIRLFGSVKSAALVDLVGRGRWWQEWSASARAFVRRAAGQWVGRWDARSAAIVTAILIGDRAGLDADTESRLQRAGTYHVIAISGGNIAILVTLVSALLRLAGATPRIQASLGIAIVLTYAAIVGSGASVARATAGATLYLCAQAIDHRSDAINILGVAIAIILVLAPLEVLDPAFWLTCVATLAILVCAERLQRQLVRLIARHASPRLAASRWTHAAAGLLAATMAAEFWLLPVSAYAFSQLTFAGLALNFAAIPLMAAAQVAGLAMLPAAALLPADARTLPSATALPLPLSLLLPLPLLKLLTPIATAIAAPIAWATGYVAHIAAYALVESARAVDLAPQVALRVPPPPLWLVLIAEACAAAYWLARLPRRRIASLIAWTSALATIVIAPACLTAATPMPLRAIHVPGHAPCAAPPLPTLQPPPTPQPQPTPLPTPHELEPGWLRVTSLDVAQGDATLIRWPDGTALLVDAGGSVTGGYDVGGRIVSPALWALGLRRLQTLALTHGDRDHIGGASAVLRDFVPRAVWEGVPVTPHPLLAALRAQAAAQGTAWHNVHTGERLDLPPPTPTPTPLRLRVWNPPTSEWERHRVRNDDSIVLEITYDRVSIVLPGDIGPDIERQLATDLRDTATNQSPAPTSLRILKAAHHGSGHSSTAAFLRALAPRIAIISAGRGNHFGHPAPATLDRYRTIDALIFRTDEDGAIELDTNGRDVFVTTCSGRRLHLVAPAQPASPATPAPLAPTPASARAPASVPAAASKARLNTTSPIGWSQIRHGGGVAGASALAAGPARGVGAAALLCAPIVAASAVATPSASATHAAAPACAPSASAQSARARPPPRRLPRALPPATRAPSDRASPARGTGRATPGVAASPQIGR